MKQRIKDLLEFIGSHQVSNDTRANVLIDKIHEKLNYILVDLEQSTKYNCSCLDNAKEDEPIFVLRAQDVSAPYIIMEWLKFNIESAPPEKLKEALDCAIKMRGWLERKIAD